MCHQESRSFMFPFGRKSTDQKAKRDLRAKRREESKLKSSHIFSLPRVEGPPRANKETLPTNNPLERGASLPNYLDLAVDSDPRRDTNLFRARTLVIPPTSGTVERPTPSRPAVVNLRSQKSGKQSLEAPRRSVDSLVQQYSP